MDRISQLPDALLLKVLSLVPTENVVTTSVLSKRWRSLWKMVPKLDYDDSKHDTEYGRFSHFVYRSLLLNKAAVLESLILVLGPKCAAVDIGIWVEIAVGRHVRQLELDLYSDNGLIRLPSRLYTCETLETLKLYNEILVDVPSSVCFQSLKTLHLVSVGYSDNESVHRLLSSCPVLEDLFVEQYPQYNVTTFTIAVPSLQRLSIYNNIEGDGGGFMINTPSLKYLKISDPCYCDFRLIESIPELVDANVEVKSSQTEKLLGCLSSAERLSLCLSPSRPQYPSWAIFYRLVCLELCTSHTTWWGLFARVLEDSPILWVLTLNKKHNEVKGPRVCCTWNKPFSVPECLSSHLETFKWRGYGGTQGEEELATYILENAAVLRMVTIFSESNNVEEKHKMLKKLAFVSRCSSACQLTFD